VPLSLPAPRMPREPRPSPSPFRPLDGPLHMCSPSRAVHTATPRAHGPSLGHWEMFGLPQVAIYTHHRRILTWSTWTAFVSDSKPWHRRWRNGNSILRHLKPLPV
jgi:hypothetical protein